MTKQIQLGDVSLPADILTYHTAILGKTGSGKTSTGKLFVEHVAEDGARVCVLDPIKSDWWGLTSSANGKKAGLPFQILGGPRGHVPLHASAGKAIGEIVANGRLPLSILDMADFPPGGLSQFFIDFAARLLQKMRGVLYLVIEEAHLFAPKERSGIGQENMAIHWAKTMATAGRSKGIRLVLLTQRTQALHNALLGSCDTMIAHRLTAPADQAPVEKWLAANAPKDVIPQIKQSLSKVKTGSAWLCSGELGLFEAVDFPRIKTFDNTKTPTRGSGAVRVKTAPVDTDKLLEIVGDAVEEAKANDPKELKRRIAELERDKQQLARQKPAAAAKTVVHREVDASAVTRAIAARDREWQAWAKPLRAFIDRQAHGIVRVRTAVEQVSMSQELYESLAAGPELSTAAQPGAQNNDGNTIAIKTPRAPMPRPAAETNHAPIDGLMPAHQRILDALAWFESVGITQPSRANVATIAGASSKSSSYMNNISRLSSLAFVEYPRPGLMSLTDSGRGVAHAPEDHATLDDLHAAWFRALSPAEGRILKVVIDSRDAPLTRDDLASHAGASSASSSFMNNLSHLSSLGLVKYPARGQVVANNEVLFPEGLS